MADNYTQVTRPYPSDAPTVVTDWNPACVCGHAQHGHDYSGDQFRQAWGVCTVTGCACQQFEEPEDDEPEPRPCYHCGTPGIDMRHGKDCCAQCAKELDDEQDQREKGDDDGREYSDPRDEIEDRLRDW